VVVKLKGKLEDLTSEIEVVSHAGAPPRGTKNRQLRSEAQTALSHLGFRSQEVERVLNELGEEIWAGDLQLVIKQALNNLSGNL